MQIFVIAAAFISWTLIAVEGNGSGSPSSSPCYDQCNNIPNFPGDTCTNLEYISFGVCSYACSCDGYYGYRSLLDTTPCGYDKVCYQGVCRDLAKDVNCNKYGDCYIAVYDPDNPCSYQCVQNNGCDVYEENKPCGTCCYNSQSLRTGTCKKGICTVVGGRGCNRRLYYPYIGETTISSSKSSGSGRSKAEGHCGDSDAVANAFKKVSAVAGANACEEDIASASASECQGIAKVGKLCRKSANTVPDNFTLKNLTDAFEPPLKSQICSKAGVLVSSTFSLAFNGVYPIDFYAVLAIVIVILLQFGINDLVCLSASINITRALFKVAKYLTLDDFFTAFSMVFDQNAKTYAAFSYFEYLFYKTCVSD